MNHELDGKDDGFNLARFFVNHRQVAWALLVAMLAWGVAGYMKMPKRKDPEIPVRVALAVCPWPGITADRVEELVTRKIERAASGNSKIEKIESTTRDGIAVVRIHLHDSVAETVEQFADIGQRVTHIPDLPRGAGPVTWVSDFGDTAALMLTVASPKVGAAEVRIRGAALRKAIEAVRGAEAADRVTALYCFPQGVSPSIVERPFGLFAAQSLAEGVAREARPVSAAGCTGIDLATSRTDAQLRVYLQDFVRERLGNPDIHPDAWGPVFVRDASQAADRLSEVAGDLYTYRQLDDFTHEIERVLQNVPIVAKVSRSGVLEERIFVDYAQERLASASLQPSSIVTALASRNTTMSGGVFDTGARHVVVDPNVRDRSFHEMDDLLVGSGASGTPVRIRDVAVLSRGYESPPRYLNYLVSKDGDGRWRRNRAITLAVQMRSGEQIGRFGAAVDEALEKLRRKFPPDLIVARTSDQPRQVAENVSLFMVSLYEAIFLVVVVSLIGFWNWRSALLIATSIPITLAMTFGAMLMLGVDIQQVSIATLIIALGLLVDDPVVAGDAIKRDLALGHPRVIAAWLGPTKLATAILYATITNIVAYLPFLMIKGNTGEFLYSLPVVLTCSLIASRLVSMTFIPLLSYYLLRPKAEKPVEERRKKGFAAQYYKVGKWAINHRWIVMTGAMVFLLLGGGIFTQLKTQFFPKDLSYLSYVDVWLPEDAPLSATNEAAAKAEEVIREVSAEYSKEHGIDGSVLQSLTTFVGGGGPRFWFSVSPELQQLNYAQIILQVKDKHDTSHLIGAWQKALSEKVPGARIDVRQLESGKAVGLPVSIRLSGEDPQTLRSYAERVKTILNETRIAERVRDDWGDENFTVRLKVDPDRANAAGLTNQDVAMASLSATTGHEVTKLREGDKQIPVVARLRMEERAQLGDLKNLYVYSSSGKQKIHLSQVATTEYGMQTEKMRARNQFRTITVAAMPEEGRLASEVMKLARPQLTALSQEMPVGYRLEVGGEEEDQVKGFKDLAIVLGISVTMIFLALVFQFKNAIKPFIVFAAVPFGMVGALSALWIMGQPFGFMAFLGIVSLVGVIVSHIIVLFDFIEEKHAEGEPLVQALLDAGIMRLRPVLITVGATVIALFPLASHGGPLWEPMCYAQIGGLSVATFITLLLVPVIYAIFVLDLKLVKWEKVEHAPEATPDPVVAS